MPSFLAAAVTLPFVAASAWAINLLSVSCRSIRTGEALGIQSSEFVSLSAVLCPVITNPAGGERSTVRGFLLRVQALRINRRLTQTPYKSNQTALSKVAEIATGGALDHVDREFEQTDFPRVVHALNNRAERFVFAFDLAPGATDHGVD